MSPADQLGRRQLLLAARVEHLADALFVAARQAVDARVAVDRAGEDPEVGNLADVRIGHGLEDERRPAGRWQSAVSVYLVAVGPLAATAGLTAGLGMNATRSHP